MMQESISGNSSDDHKIKWFTNLWQEEKNTKGLKLFYPESFKSLLLPKTIGKIKGNWELSFSAGTIISHDIYSFNKPLCYVHLLA